MRRRGTLYFSKSFNTQPPEGGWGMMYQTAEMRNVFQHTAARRRLVCCYSLSITTKRFQHTAARRRLEMRIIVSLFEKRFQHTAARRRLGWRTGWQ